MIKAVKAIVLCFLLSFFSLGFTQNRVTTFGLQFKPIISSEIINTGAQTSQEGEIGFSIEPNQGYSFGMVVRKGFTPQLSLETGINFTRRNYKLIITEDTTGFRGESDFSYVIYEIPVLALVYVQLGQNSFLNGALGASLNFLPSNWDSFDSYFIHFSQRKSWIVPALLANLGYEFRTYDKGYLYLGFSYHRPFTEITTAGIAFREDNLEQEVSFFDISGNYLTIDLRYFFHEPPDKRKRKRR